MKQEPNPNRLLLASLGTGEYGEAYYMLDGKRSKKTRLSFHALAEHLNIPFEHLRIFGTKPDLGKNLSKGSSWGFIREAFGRNLDDDQKIIVPFGLDKEEHYQFFKCLIDVVKGSDELVVDMTHGFRSFPVILLMSLFFSEAIHENPFKSVRIFYGAYEAGRDLKKTYLNSKGEEKPVKEVDLVEMKIIPELLTWTKATERLIKFGLAGDLEEQIGSVDGIKQNWDKCFGDLNLALTYNAVHLIPKAAKKVEDGFRHNKRVINEQAPVFYLQDSISKLVNELDSGSVSERQLKVARYFKDIGRYGQVAVVLLEYVITKITERYLELINSGEKPENKETRKLPAKLIGLLMQRNQDSSKNKNVEEAKRFYKEMEKWNIEKTEALVESMDDLGKIRNIFAHGKQVDMGELEKHHRNVENLMKGIQDLSDFSDAPVDHWIEFVKNELP